MSSAQTDHEYYMRLAMAEAAMCAAAGGRPFGSVVVHDGVVIGRSGARKDSSKNPTGHAEIIAIQEAAQYLGTADMTGCTMYTNRGSCAMCSATMVSNTRGANTARYPSPKPVTPLSSATSTMPMVRFGPFGKLHLISGSSASA